MSLCSLLNETKDVLDGNDFGGPEFPVVWYCTDEQTTLVTKMKSARRSHPTYSHAYSAKSAPISRRSPDKWSKEEDELLKQLIEKYGEKKWKNIAMELGTEKTGAQCAQHWKRVLSPRIKKGPWTEKEEERLHFLVDMYGQSWKEIAKRMGERSDIQCRYQYLKNKGQNPWSQREDDILLDAFNKDPDFERCAQTLDRFKFPRTAFECKLRHNSLVGNEIVSRPKQQPLNTFNTSSQLFNLEFLALAAQQQKCM